MKKQDLRAFESSNELTKAAIYDYYDEDYFQNGQKKGTAYWNYIEGSRSSNTYKEIAQSINYVFQPKMVLEIGCATGIIIKHLNDLGVEAYGVDVSEFAIKNKEHVNIILSACDKLPFNDKAFDLVFSCHALEHLPDECFKASIAEIDRVCSGYQFHMLPILQQGPYIGDEKAIIENLKNDPTHYQLYTVDKWMSVFGEYYWKRVNSLICFENDTQSCELTTCQFTLQREYNDDQQIIERTIELNKGRFKAALDAARVDSFIQSNEISADIVSLSKDLLEMKKSMDYMLNSTSWRVTKPCRAIMRKIKRQR